LTTELFHPAPQGLPIAIRPPRGSRETLQTLDRFDWNGLGSGRNGELLKAGALWLYGFLDESHSIAQGIDSAEGSYWHALMHRSEGDFSNSKYWYRRVGCHAIFPELLNAARQLEVSSQSMLAAIHEISDWDPFRLVDAMDQADRRETGDKALIQVIVQQEYNLLMSYCLVKIQ
jgi:hypothetical protein